MQIKILKKVLAANDQVADDSRKHYSDNGVLTINLMSSPGSGKTTLIEKTIQALKGKKRIGVVEGDIETSLDAEKIAKHGVPIVSINTGPFGGACHLEAAWIRQAADQIDLNETDLLFVENIGNMVCPAEFDTGSHFNVAVLSTPEGEDKPLKYPLLFNTSQVVVINKCDLLGVLDLDIDLVKENIKKVNPKSVIIELSTKTGEGLDKWTDWLLKELG